MFYPQSSGRTTFKWPADRQLRIKGCVSRELLAVPDCFDSNGEPCLIVMKNGNATDLTVGRYAGLEAYLCDNSGVESIELAIYNYNKHRSPLGVTQARSSSMVRVVWSVFYTLGCQKVGATTSPSLPLPGGPSSNSCSSTHTPISTASPSRRKRRRRLFALHAPPSMTKTFGCWFTSVAQFVHNN